MDGFDLARFSSAQDPVYDAVVAELTAGRKRTHWMWFIFPQIRGLGTSPTAQTYAIRSLAEARAYLDDHVLGHRLRECTTLVLACGVTDTHRIFGSPDDLKFHSSMTLFATASRHAVPFTTALSVFCGGKEDAATIKRLREA